MWETLKTNSYDGASFEIFDKIVDKSVAYIGDTLTYTINFVNTGNKIANNTIIFDTLPFGVEFVKNSIFFNGAQQYGMNFDFPKGVSLGDIPPSKENSLSFKVMVTTLPVGNSVSNTSDLSYKYRVQINSETIPAYDTSNIIKTEITINYMVMNSIKYVDKEYAEVGDTLTYSIVYKNEGNTSANEVRLLDSLAVGITFIEDSLKVNGETKLGMNLDSALELDSINVGITTVSFEVMVETIPSVNPISNKATTSYKYTVQTTLPNFYQGTTSTEKVYTRINNVIVEPFKTVDKEFADIGETLEYTIIITSLGNITANNIILLDTISSACSFKSNSLVVNGIRRNTGYINNSFDIGTIPLGKSIISYDVIVNTIPNENSVDSYGTINYKYTINPQCPNAKNKSVNINGVSTKVNTVFLNANNYVNKKYANIGDTLEYTIEIINTGNIDACNVRVQNTIPNAVTYVEGSLEIDGNNVPNIDMLSEWNIGTVPVGTTTVAYKVMVDKIPKGGILENISYIKYSYYVNPEINKSTDRIIRTNIASTKINSVLLEPLNIVDKNFADVGETLQYKIPIINKGNIKATHVVIVETIPEGISYINKSTQAMGNVVVGSVLYNNLNRDLTIDIGTVPIGTSTISFKVLVDTIPIINPIITNADISYDYTVDPSIPYEVKGEIISNEAITKVNTVFLNCNENVDKEYGDVGDSLVYTIEIINIGNVKASNVVITSTIPEGTDLLTATAIVDGIEYDLWNLTSKYFQGNIEVVTLPIADIPIGTTTVNINVIVTTIPSTGYAKNSATIDFDYTVNPDFPNSYKGVIYTNEASTKINCGKLTSISSTSTEYVDIGDSITYTTQLSNVGNVEVSNVIFRDTLPVGVDFIIGSLKRDGISQSLEDPTNGFNIYSIMPGQSTTISFDVIVNSMTDENPLVTSSITTYEYLVDPNLSNGKITFVTSNLAETKINTVFLNASKLVDKVNASVGDTLIYTISIINSGTTFARDAIITDTIPENTTFLTDSLKINGVTQNGVNPQCGISIGTIPIGTTTIDFEVSVDTIPSPNGLSNEAMVVYQYDVNKAISYTKNGVAFTDKVNTDVYMVYINSSKFPNKEFVNIGDTLTYTLLISNTGNAAANNVVLPDVLSDGITFVKDSLNIDGVTIVGGDVINNEIELGTIDVGQSTVSFDVKLEGVPSPNPIGEVYSIKYKYTVDSSDINSYSGEVENSAQGIQVNYINLSNAVKTVDKNFATCNDILTYTILIPNSGNVDATNLFISDTIPPGTTYVQDSLKVNGVTIVGSPDSINIGTIPSGGVATVNFQVQVLCGGGIF